VLTKDDRTWIECHFEKLRELIAANQIDIAALKVKAGIWGLLGGLIPVVVTIALYALSKWS